jgi:hypothetical protein
MGRYSGSTEMKIQYVAEDGTVFDVEADCKEHEQVTCRGAHPRFVQAVAEALCKRVTYVDDRGTQIIPFDDDSDTAKVAIAIARHLDTLVAVYDSIRINKPISKQKVKK